MVIPSEPLTPGFVTCRAERTGSTVTSTVSVGYDCYWVVTVTTTRGFSLAEVFVCIHLSFNCKEGVVFA